MLLPFKVTNRGKTGTFWATAEILGARQVNAFPKNRTINMKWEDSKEIEVKIGRKASRNLVVASVSSVVSDWVDEMRIESFSEKSGGYVASATWNRKDEKLQEFDLEISVFLDGAKSPFVDRYTVRPQTALGPLEIFAIAVNSK